MNWQAVEAIATAFGAFIVIIGGALAWWQLREARRGRNAQIAMQVYNELRSPEATEDLRWIYGLTGLDESLEQTRERAGRVLDRLEMLGILVAERVIDEKVALNLVRGQPLRCWYRLRDYIRKQRETHGHYARFVEYYAHLSLKHQYEKVPQSEWTRLEGKDLVTELKGELLAPRKRPK